MPPLRVASGGNLIFQTMLGFTTRFDYNEVTFNRRAEEGVG